MSNEVYLKLRGSKYKGWQDVQIEKSLSALCGAFQVRLIDTDPADKTDWSLTMGAECQVYIEDQLLVTGFIEDINIEYTKESHAIVVAGRDKLGDLVDCHRAFGQSREWVNQSVLSIIRSLCAPFGFSVVVDSSAQGVVNKREEQYGFNEGDTVYETIRRLCRKHYILPVTYGDGKLVLTRTGNARATDALQTGVNILRGALRRSNRERFSHYYLKGFSLGFDEKTTSDFTHPKGDARDQLIERYRPFTIVEDVNTSTGDCNLRAKAEAALRAGSSIMYEFEVPGWLQSDGSLWRLNQLVQITDPILALDDMMLIDQLRFTQGDAGQLTTIQVCTPEKYKAEADLTKAKTGLDIFAQLGI